MSLYSVAQTTIIIERLPNDIYIATDSRRVYVAESGALRYDSVCKIRKYKNIFISIAGPNSDPIYVTAIEICKKEKSIMKITEQFKNIGKAKYKLFLDSTLKNNPEYFKRNFDNIDGISVGFCAFENNVPIVIVVEFKATMNKQISVKETTSYFTRILSKVEDNQILMGHYDNIEKETAKSMKFLEGKKSIGEILETLIEVECKADSVTVGKPINILQIYEGGYTWIQNPMKCGF